VAGDEHSGVGDGERYKVGDGGFEPDHGGGVAAHDDVELVDGEQDRADDERDGDGAAEVRPVADDGGGLTPRRSRRRLRAGDP
jgi:hypothetical protein